MTPKSSLRNQQSPVWDQDRRRIEQAVLAELNEARQWLDAWAMAGGDYNREQVAIHLQHAERLIVGGTEATSPSEPSRERE
jgi:hypothetical protein